LIGYLTISFSLDGWFEEIKKMSNLEAEEEIEKLCLEFEKLKPYLVTNWDKRE
jgi:hypothetical protein